MNCIFTNTLDDLCASLVGAREREKLSGNYYQVTSVKLLRRIEQKESRNSSVID